jgi:AraC family transcriptional regulator
VRTEEQNLHMTTSNAYAVRFNRVFDYIEKHLDEELTVESLSQVANFSKFHFHRQFSDYTGVGVFRYVQLMRLKRASYRLSFSPEARIIDIALEAGFENPESFSRAFKNTFGQTPTAFRKAPDWAHWHTHYMLPNGERKQNMDVSIVNFDSARVALIEHRGSPALVNNTVTQFIAWRKASGQSPLASERTFGIAYDNPDTTEPEKFRFGICSTVQSDVAPNDYGVVSHTIPGGRCATVRHHGPHSRIGDSIYPLYRDWLPHSGEELRDFPLFFHYLNLMPDTPEHALITDIYLPLK